MFKVSATRMMQACRRLQKQVLGLKNTLYEYLNIFKSA